MGEVLLYVIGGVIVSGCIAVAWSSHIKGREAVALLEVAQETIAALRAQIKKMGGRIATVPERRQSAADELASIRLRNSAKHDR